MRLKTLQESITNLIKSVKLEPLLFMVGGEDEAASAISELIMSAKTMAAELLQEEEPVKTLIDAFLQLLLIASILNIDLENEVRKEISKLVLISKSAGA